MGKGNIFPISNGGESAALFCFTFLYLVVAGSGAWSLDNQLWGRKTAA
jgi:putative oxidoreductase